MTETPSSLTPEQTAELLASWKKQIPALQSSVQVQAVLVAYDAFRYVVNSIVCGDTAKEVEARATLNTAFDVTRQITGVLNQLKDVPEAATGEKASAFTKTVGEEEEKQKGLLSELAAIQEVDELNHWYSRNHHRISEVKTPSLRNPLFDSIRARKSALS